jgi:hypothetical protein
MIAKNKIAKISSIIKMVKLKNFFLILFDLFYC